MKIFVAGAAGAIGSPLIKQLRQEGHDVIGRAETRKVRADFKQGATAEIADALDANAVSSSLARTRPEVVVNQLTALPKRYSPDTMHDAAPVDRHLRQDGETILQSAAKKKGARRYILQSSAFWYEPGTA